MAQKFSLTSRVKLRNGKLMPQIQLGLYLMDGKETKEAVTRALEAGYRGFDSAQMYENEKETGEAIKEFLASPANKEGLKREDIFYTTKLAENSTYSRAKKSIKESVKKCGLGYIDLFLIHSPYGGTAARLQCWKAIEDAIMEGEVMSGGVSNFGMAHIHEFMQARPPLRIKPCVNQIEVHPFNTREGIRKISEENGMWVEAYAPLARALKMEDETIKELAKKYKCTPAQLMIRWSLQHDLIPLPKSTKKARIVENGKILEKAIDDKDMEKMDELDEYLVTDWDPVNAP